ncbi:MAG: hypothetical protein A2X94_16975, partial [Bdellovibrionales bacterium GWB1_55_8]
MSQISLHSQTGKPQPGVIRVLSPAVAERIAAGEVIERPASVVKELVENSIDAGATEIGVFLEDGGKALIEVLDNGKGMPPADLSVCIERHATSKLNSLEDLDRIRTLGFRGEALPSVGAVSDLSILSRTSTSETAYELFPKPFGTPRTAPEPVTFGRFFDSSHGTRIRARGLFSQVPARLKFLKSQAAEVSHVRDWVERLALSNPGVGFRLSSDGRVLLNLRPAAEADRVRAVLSDKGDYPMVSAESAAEDFSAVPGLRVRAHWLQGMSSPQTRKLAQIVNGRAVRDRLLQQAILLAFKQNLMPGQFPALALFVEIEPSELDLNVHPTKTEIRFLNSRRIFHAVDSLLQSMIAKNGAAGFAPGCSPSYSRDYSRWTASEEQSPSHGSVPAPVPETPLSAERYVPANPTLGPQLSLSSVSSSTAVQNPIHPSSFHHPFNEGRFVGTLFNTYIVYDTGHELVCIDQHAADERIRYERLRNRLTDPASAAITGTQSLLVPEAVHFPAEERPKLEERLPWLDTLGFEAELFGEDALLIRSIPGEWGDHSLRPRLKGL